MFPGAQIINVTRGGACSVGFAGYVGNTRVIATVGHCGNKGDVFAFNYEANGRVQQYQFGRMIFSYQDKGGGLDYGLIATGNAPVKNTF